jgi:hypothetical protein
VSAAELWTVGYGLDDGGYAFEPVDCDSGVPGDLQWDDPDTNYFPFGAEEVDYGRGLSLVLLIQTCWPGLPNAWPVTYTDDNGDRYDLRSHGTVEESDRDCGCNGLAMAERDDEHRIVWEFTGNGRDPAYPECPRCDGTGYVTSPGGAFAWYSVHEYPTMSEWYHRIPGAVRVWRCGADWINGAVQLTQPDPGCRAGGLFLIDTDGVSVDGWEVVLRTVDSGGEYDDTVIATLRTEEAVTEYVVNGVR